MNIEKRLANIEIQQEESTDSLKKGIVEVLEEKEVENRELVMRAIELAEELHLDQKVRPDGPYINHILRVMRRILEEFGVYNDTVLIGAALHDSLEDQQKKLAAKMGSAEVDMSDREKAVGYLTGEFGEDASGVIESVTHDDPDPSLSAEEKNAHYVQYVKSAVRNEKVMWVKLSDFEDNAMRLGGVSNEQRRHRLAQKYIPVFDILISRLQEGDIVMSDRDVAKIVETLREGKEVANRILSTPLAS